MGATGGNKLGKTEERKGSTTRGTIGGSMTDRNSRAGSR